MQGGDPSSTRPIYQLAFLNIPYDNLDMLAERPADNVPVQARRRGRPPNTAARTDVLAALGRLLAEADYDAISIEDILSRAGVSRATYYKHFNSKEDALIALFTQVADDVRNRVLAAMEQADDARTLIEDGVTAYAHALLSIGRLAPAFNAAQYRFPQMYAQREETVRRYVEQLSTMLPQAGLPDVPDFLLDGLIAGVDRIVQRFAADCLAGSAGPDDIDRMLSETRRVLAAFLAVYTKPGPARRRIAGRR